MHRFKNILCVVNPDEKASAVVKRARELATLQGTSLTLVHVARDATQVQGESAGERPIEDNKLIGELESRPLYGNPSEEIVKQVLRGKHDLLIKPVAGAENQPTTLDATDKFLLRQCPCPVWLFKPVKRASQERILVALDSDMDGVNEKLNELVLDFSTSLGAEDETELHVVSSWGVSGEEAMRSRVGTLAIRRLVAGMRRANMKWLRSLTAPYTHRGAKLRVHLEKGKHNDAILAEAKKRRPDLIVMGDTGPVGIAGLLFGTAAERIFSRVNCSVLAVKPKGFVSTVDA
jgi:nucleotide-binding universal stress UspA family protein